MMKRILSFVLGAALIFVLVVPVSAAQSSGWIELLEYSSVQSNGENWFTMTNTGSFTISLQGEKRLRKVDILLWHPNGQRPDLAWCTTAGQTFTLSIYPVGGNISRITGYIADAWYEKIKIDLSKPTSSSQSMEVLSFRVTPLGLQEFDCEGYTICQGVRHDLYDLVTIPGAQSQEGATFEQVGIAIEDWQKYDTITLWGSISDMPVNSIRATIGSIGVPFTVSYTEPLNGGFWYEHDEFESGYTDDMIYSGEDWTSGTATIIPEGKMLFAMTLDLTGIDRTNSNILVLYFTGLYEPAWGFTYHFQQCKGGITTADTTDVSWWHRFTNFMTDLFGVGNSQDSLDDLGSSSNSISQDAANIHSFEQSQQAVLDNNFSAIQSSVTFTNFAAALSFVQRYSNMAFSGISDFAIVFTLPLFLGLFFYLCSRIPGVTRWKSRPPKGKGGGDP